MKDMVVNTCSRFKELAVLLPSVTALLCFTLFLTSGCSNKEEGAEQVSSETSERLMRPNEIRFIKLSMFFELGNDESRKIASLLEEQTSESRELCEQLANAFGTLSESEREEIKNALKDGNVEEKFSGRSDALHIKTMFDELLEVESSLKKYQTASDKYLQKFAEREALIDIIQEKIRDEKFFKASDVETNVSSEPVTTRLLDRLGVLNCEIMKLTQSSGDMTSPGMNTTQETGDLLDKIVENAKSQSICQDVDIVLANKHSNAGYVAFAKANYCLAKEEGETALTFDPNCKGAKVLLEKTDVELDKLSKMTLKGKILLDFGEYVEAFREARRVKSCCVNYPDADALEKKALDPIVNALIAKGEKALANNDINTARETVKKVKSLCGNNPDADALEKKALDAMVNVLIVKGEKALANNNMNAARETVKKVKSLCENNPNADALERNVLDAMVNALIAEGEKNLANNEINAAYETVRNVKSLCADCPDAEVLEKIAFESMVNALITLSESALANNDGSMARNMARETLELDSDNTKAGELEKKALVLIVNALIAEGESAFANNDVRTALDKAREALELDSDNAKAGELEKKAIKLIVNALIAEGESAFANNDVSAALDKAREALELDSDNTKAGELEKKAIELIVNALITEGEGAFANNDVSAAFDKACEALELDSDNAKAWELKKKARKSRVNAAVARGWEAYGADDKKGALAEARRALELDPGDKDAKKLLLECDPFRNTEPGYRATLAYNGVEFVFRYCPAGVFVMGSPSNESGRLSNEEPHFVAISEGFWICETEITQQQWVAVMWGKYGKEHRDKKTVKTIPDVFSAVNRGYPKRELIDTIDGDILSDILSRGKFPVRFVSCDECSFFVLQLCKLNIAPEGWRFDLPSDEQWEYACRAGTSGSTYGIALDDCAWHDSNSGGEPHEVGTKEPNQWGIYDMLGNVWEWTGNWESISIRGGCNRNTCRPAARFDFDEDKFGCSPFEDRILRNCGFRCVLERTR